VTGFRQQLAINIKIVIFRDYTKLEMKKLIGLLKKFYFNKWSIMDTKDQIEISINAIIALAAIWVLLQNQAIIKNSQQSLNDARKWNNEARDDWEKENRPFIEVADITVHPLIVNTKATMSFKLINSGKFAAKIISTAHTVGYGSDEFFQTVQYPPFDRRIVNTFVGSSNSYFPIQTSVQFLLTQDHINNLNNGSWHYVLKGEIKYENAITHKPYTNSYLYEISGNGKDIVAVSNDDIQVVN